MKLHRFSLIIPIVLMAAVLLAAGSAHAAPPDPAPPAQGVDNDTCLACHNTPGLQKELPSGEILYLTVDRITYRTSSHGRQGYACVQCHTDIREFPHPENTAETLRDLTLELYTSCKRCHQEKYDSSLDDVHGRALAGGNENAAVCTDCHNPHNTQNPSQPRSRIPRTCERCHSEIVTAL